MLIQNVSMGHAVITEYVFVRMCKQPAYIALCFLITCVFIGQREFWIERNKPDWWPEDISFASPNGTRGAYQYLLHTSIL